MKTNRAHLSAERGRHRHRLPRPADRSGASRGQRRRRGRPSEPTSSNDIVVQADIGFRNRSGDTAEPVLVYGEEYFQRFEPLTAGDALKRVPSVTFLSDVIESDGPRLRGLAPGLHPDPDQRREGAGAEPRPFVLPRPHSRPS